MRNLKAKGSLVVLTLLAAMMCMMLIRCTGSSVKEWEKIEAGFQDPPSSAKPRVWWHWMNGNITQHGIREDLEWMDRIGIGGFQNFDAALATPQIVEERLVYMTPAWKDAFRFATDLADSLGLEMAIAGSPGWSESGGPWVPPAQGMKKYVWSEIFVEGGEVFEGILPKPPSTTGVFQNLGIERGFSMSGEEVAAPPEYYADAAVVAYKLPADDIPLSALQPKVTSSGGDFNLTMLTDGDLVTSSYLPPVAVGENAWIQYELDEPQTMQSLTIVGGGSGGRFGFGTDPDNRILESSEDGTTWQKVIDIPSGGVGQKTLSFAPVTAKYFRFAFKTMPPAGMPGGLGEVAGFFGDNIEGGTPMPSGTQVAELVLHTVPRVDRFEEKAAFATATDLMIALQEGTNNEDVIKRSDIVDLTGMMEPDGSIEWLVPEGNWMIVRLGYSLTGHQNSPASPEATGLEVDKLNPDYVKAYFENYLDQYKSATGGLMGEEGLQYIITDSWEAGVANWTDNMKSEFNRRNDYDIIHWIPVLTGHVVESAAASDRFLWDFRLTLGDMVAEYHYDALTDILHERQMGRYTESHENQRAFIGDGMEVKRAADIPMSATWTPGGFGGSGTGEVEVRHKADVRESASVAHIYGQNLVAAESLTAIGNTWAFSPERLKPTADIELASGLNRFVIHTSVHQPVDDKIPGLGLGPFGQWFTRHETWAEDALPWTTYLARSSYMLQQGQTVADVACLYGQDQNITAIFGNQLPDVPEGYEYDFINADALIHVLSAEDEEIVAPSGMRYRLLAVDSSAHHMTLPVLHKIRELVYDGVPVVGPKPVGSPSLNDDQEEFTEIADELWGPGRGKRTVGKGVVYAGLPIARALEDLGIAPDFTYTKAMEDAEVLYVHRTLPGGDIYWINNRSERYAQVKSTFRIEGRSAEIWNPETGEIRPASYSMENGRTMVPLTLKPHDAVFVVFREKAREASRIIPVPVEVTIATLEGPWKVSFQPDRGAPASITFDNLMPWNEHSIAGVKYFSGTATYTKTFLAPDGSKAEGQEVWLDLGEVKNLAEVSLNGINLGIVWKTPFRVNLTDALRDGENNLEIKVTNLWVNRLIGDQQPGVTNPVTYTTQAFYRADSPLLPSGLLGPVQLLGLKTE